MAGSALLVLKVVTDAKDAAKGLDDTSESVGRFHTGMQKVGAAAAVAGGAVLAFGLDAAKAAAEDAKGQALLATALKNSTGARQSDIKSVEDWISKTAAATGVADDELRPALATLARATGDVAKSQDAMRIALDVSAATGKDLGSVTDALAKGFAGSTTALGKLVPGLDKATVSGGDMNKIMAELARTTGGSAAAAAETTEGKMARMKLAMDETKESIGAALLPALTALANLLLKVSTWAQDNTTVFLILMGVIGGMAIAVAAYSVAQKVATVATGIWTAATWLLNAAFWANPITWIVAGIVALIAVIVIIATKTTWFQDIWNAAFKLISDVVQGVWGWIKSNWPMLLTILTGPIGIAVNIIVRYWDQIKGAALAVYNWLKDVFVTVWDTVKNATILALNIILAPIHAIEAAFNAVVSAVKTVIEWIGKIKIPSIGGMLSSLNPFKSAPAPAVANPAVAGFGAFTTGAASRATTSSGGGITINITGAIDPVSTAQQIRRILRDDTRRRGGVVVGMT